MTTASYTSTAPLTLRQAIMQGPSTSVVTDGLGRTVQNTLAAPEGTICTESFYDADGNTSAVNHPQLGCSGLVVAGVAVQTTHDALGRKLVQTNEDGTTVQWGYNGITTSTTDEAGHTTSQVVDALDRLIHVGEATGTSTDYTYDGFGNLTAISQWGVSGDTSRQRSFAYDGLSRLLISNNPETGIVCYGTWSGGSVGSGTCGNGYDLNGDLLAKTDARGLGVLFGYDVLNRVTNKRYFGPGYVDGAIKQFFYDGANASGALAVQANSNLAGRLSMARSWAPYGNNSYDEYFAYGSTGLLSRQTDVAQSESGSGGHTSSVTYDQAGHPHSLTYPSGRVLTYGYDSAGRASTITDANGTAYVASVFYFPNGTPNVTISPNFIAQQNTVNNRLQVCETAYGNQYGTLMDRQYFFGTNNFSGSQCNPVAGNNGNIFHVMDGLNVMNSQHYSYDALNRLTQFNGSSPAGAVQQQSFGYDSFGNLTQASGSTPLQHPPSMAPTTGICRINFSAPASMARRAAMTRPETCFAPESRTRRHRHTATTKKARSSQRPFSRTATATTRKRCTALTQAVSASVPTSSTQPPAMKQAGENTPT